VHAGALPDLTAGKVSTAAVAQLPLGMGDSSSGHSSSACRHSSNGGGSGSIRLSSKLQNHLSRERQQRQLQLLSRITGADLWQQHTTTPRILRLNLHADMIVFLLLSYRCLQVLQVLRAQRAGWDPQAPLVRTAGGWCVPTGARQHSIR
jgi:hypothetical protein